MNAKEEGQSNAVYFFCSSDVIVLTNFYVSLCSEGEKGGPKNCDRP